MFMVIFGAGASHDSDPTRPANSWRDEQPRPPLAKDLIHRRYGSIASKYPGSLAVIDYIEQRLVAGSTDNLEQLLAQYAQRCEHSHECRQALVAFRFYLCHVIEESSQQWLEEVSGRTSYLSLVNYLLEWQQHSHEQIYLVTFNYDMLLEAAIAHVIPNWQIATFRNYTCGKWSLVKLHGSVNWSRVDLVDELRGRFGQPISRTNAAKAIVEADKLYADRRLKRDHVSALNVEQEGEVRFPAIAIPTSDKATFECEQNHVEAFTKAVPQVNRLLICGWRGAEAHAVDILNKLSPGYYFGIVTADTDGLHDVETNLGHAITKGKPLLQDTDGMSAFVQQLHAKLGPLLMEPW